ncbi:phage tail protein [Edwardsiella piscicida]|uniref:phage tail protein n=1 Tax=Edwardsiella piscicida TaxID=1263550 RepID=UPI000D507324|nr:phage tail protein [Edwardsiella piscicida]UCQ23060.1 phage tail protein [Edwardsiella piscicida]
MAISTSFLANLGAGLFLNQALAKPDKQFSWGDYNFSMSGGNPLSGISRSLDGGWVEVPLLNELPLLQQTGRKLDTVTFTGRWYSTDGEAQIENMKKIRDEAKPRTLVRGDGVSYGQYVLRAFEVKGEQMIHNGTCVVQDITISLCEFANPSLGSQRR